jgi:hypothetical protein
MASCNNSELFTPGTTANKYTRNDWAFQGNTAFEPVYEGNFEADIDAIAESIGDDSGYYSNDADSSEPNISEFASYEGHSSPSKIEVEIAGSVHRQHNFYADAAAAASNKSNQGSIYNGTLNKSTTHLEKDGSFGKQPKEARMSKTLYHPVHEFEHKPPHKYSSVKSEAGDQRPLKIWKSALERHEWLAYRLEQPAHGQSSKRRKTGVKKLL